MTQSLIRYNTNCRQYLKNKLAIYNYNINAVDVF